MTVLFLLSQVRSFAQEVEFVRDLAFWLSINGRVGEFISGLICSEDLFYFILVSTMFIFFTIIKLQADRTKAPWYRTSGKVFCVIVATFMLGYLSSRPKLMWFYDATETKHNTLTKMSQDIVAKVNDKMTITFYFNILDENNFVYSGFPRQDLVNIKRFRQYVRFKPDIKMKFVRFHAKGNNEKALNKRFPGLTDEERMLKLTSIYGVDSNLYMKTKEDIDAMEPLMKYENYRLSMILERENGQKCVLRVFNDMYVWPFENEISAAFRRISEKLPRVAFLTGHEERSVRVIADRGYNTFAANKVSRAALINQGFDFVEVNLNEEIPADIKILVMPETKEPLTAVEEANFEKYLNRGGNIIIGSEPRRYDVYKPFINKYFGVDVCEGQLVSPDTIRVANLSVNWPTREAASEIAYHFGTMIRYEQCVTMPTAMGLDYSKAAEKGFKVVELVKTNDTYWNEKQTTDFVDDVPVLNPEKGEVKKSWVTAIAMSREINGQTQKVVVLGDADCLSNGELGISRRGIRASNFSMTQGLFFWLTDYTTPIDTRRPLTSDRSITMGPTGLIIWKVVSFGLIPVALTLCGILIWIRRKGR
jgi:ABC-2 type transport system permease protein